MATLERYNSFEELKNSEPVSIIKKKPAKETPGQKAFKEFGKLLRENMVYPPAKKNNP